MHRPSSDPEAERLLIASLLDSSLPWTNAAQAAVETLGDEDVTGQLAPVWASIRRVALSGQQPDPINVAAVAGEPWTVTRLSSLVDDIDITAVEAAVSTLVEMARHRRLIRGLEAVSKSENTDAAVSALESLIADMERTADRSLPPSLGELSEKAFTDAKDAAARRAAGEQDVSLGVPTGIPKLDWMTGGFEPGSLSILAARTSVGKTSVAIQFSRKAQDRGPVLVISREVRGQALGRKVLASTASGPDLGDQITSPMLRNGRISPTHIQTLGAMVRAIKTERIYVDDRSRTVDAIHAQARRVQSVHGRLALIAVDYVQLLAPNVPKDATREQAVASISRGLKELAIALDVPVLALAQLNRTAANVTPELHHLRDSGAIEQDADLVMFLHVPEGESADKRRDLIVAKQRDGQVGTIPCLWLAHRQEIRELDERMGATA